ncbi:MAG: phenylacetate-coenzyme A ligase [Candidatus Hydrogenedentota bacterium]
METLTFPDRSAIETRQLDQLRALIGELLRGNPYYGKILRDCGINEDIASLMEFSEKMPFSLKQQLVEDQRQNPPFGTNLTYPLERYVRFSQTSATTGKPMRWLDTPESWGWMLGNWRRVFEAAGVTNADRVYFAFSFGPFLGFWTAYESATTMGCLCIPGGGLSSPARLTAILENEVTVICCTPTYAIRLAEVAAEEGIDLSGSKVRRIIVAGEPGGSIPGTRSRIESAWPGASVFDHHGMTEVGPVSYECPNQPGTLHIIEESYYAEVIDPESGQPVEPYSTGELVLTTLGRAAMPLLRYRTGDLVVLSPDSPCACGSHELALPGGILARTDDMVVVRGVNIFPTAIEEVMRRCAGLGDYRVLIRQSRAMAELEIEVEPAADCADSKAMVDHLEHELRDVFAMRIPVTLVAPGSLPRFEMKAKRWMKV